MVLSFHPGDRRSSPVCKRRPFLPGFPARSDESLPYSLFYRLFRLNIRVLCTQEQRIRQALASVSVVNWFSNHCRRRRIRGCTQGARQAQNRQNTGRTSCVRRVPAVGRPAGRCMGKTVLPYTAEDAPAPLDVRTGCAERPKRFR